MTEQKKVKKGFSGLQVLGIVLIVMVVTVIATLLAARAYLFPKPFEPVVLTQVEQKQLEQKLDSLDTITTSQKPQTKNTTQQSDHTPDGRLRPEAYTEDGASRKVSFTEREINSLIATNTDLADKLAIDLADDLVSARMLVPLDPDFPVLGGKVLRVKAGVELAYSDGRPVVKIRGVSLMGVPVPNAWLGGVKNVDLVKEFGAEDGGWKTFSDGVDSISVAEGKILVQLKE